MSGHRRRGPRCRRPKGCVYKDYQLVAIFQMAIFETNGNTVAVSGGIIVSDVELASGSSDFAPYGTALTVGPSLQGYRRATNR